MKNVVIFQDWIREKTYGHSWNEKELFAYFRAQIDNSIRCGWDTADIVVCTNLDFKYKDVTILQTQDILGARSDYGTERYDLVCIFLLQLTRDWQKLNLNWDRIFLC